MQSKFQRMKKIILAVSILMGTSSLVYGQEVLTLERTMDIAAQNSPNLRTSFMNLERYQQNLIAQRASLKSKFLLNITPIDYSKRSNFDSFNSKWYNSENFNSNGTFRIEQPILWTDGLVSLTNTFGWQNGSSSSQKEGSNKKFNNNLSLRLEQPIFTYNRRKMELRRIEFDLENANISYALQRLNTEKQITNQFYMVYMAQSNLEISKEELTNAQQSYDIIKNKVEADLAAKDELFQAELNLATANSSVEERIVSLSNAKDQLKQTLGMGLDEDIVVFAEVKINEVEVDLNKAIEQGLNSRLELRQREIATEELDFQMITTKALNEFKGNVDLSFGFTGVNEKFEHIYKDRMQSPTISVSFSVPLFDWGEKKARIRAQKIAQQINRLEAHEERKDIELNIRQTWRSLENLKTQIRIAEQNVRNAQLTYDLNIIRYREGDITGMDMNQFQTQLSSKKMTYSQALINYKIELLNLKILSLYDFENNMAIVPLKDINSEK
ncbi:TolC family protein [Bacteroides sp. 224]|uniref:TolC family protein n=1 Tax=Bacteroides sp. 224 TaxID=2302936 RepID=UPI0013D2F618|nr:TolC family protein [Bacteroides sp. 224]NDV64517.1 TolC family protein [Bacteroides sp. 224]